MAQKNIDDITREAVEAGGFLCLLYFDVHGESKDKLQNLLVGFVGKMSQEPGVTYALGEIDAPIEHGTAFSSIAEVKLLAKDFPSLVSVCANYAPVGIEILKPSDVKITLGELQEGLLRVSQMTQAFADVMIQKNMTAAERETFKGKVAAKEELGKRLMEKKREKNG
jgi:hypothetical protein